MKGAKIFCFFFLYKYLLRFLLIGVFFNIKFGFECPNLSFCFQNVVVTLIYCNVLNVQKIAEFILNLNGNVDHKCTLSLFYHLVP